MGNKWKIIKAKKQESMKPSTSSTHCVSQPPQPKYLDLPLPPTQPESGPTATITTSPLTDPLIVKEKEKVDKQKLWNTVVRDCHIVFWTLIGVIVSYSLGMKVSSSTWPIPFNSFSLGSILVYAVSSMVAIVFVSKPWRAIPDVLALTAGLVAVHVPLFYLFGVIFGTVSAIVFVSALVVSFWVCFVL